jgi:hypothetical protein
MQDYILRVFGSPEQFGALTPAGGFLNVGRALSQHFLPLVAEGRIVIKPWVSTIQGQSVRFSDESFEEFDAIILGTGFELSLPFLSPAICSRVNLDPPACRPLQIHVSSGFGWSCLPGSLGANRALFPTARVASPLDYVRLERNSAVSAAGPNEGWNCGLPVQAGRIATAVDASNGTVVCA